jgi:hypothetical protein
MGRIKMDFEEMIIEEADEMALKETGFEFSELPSPEQMTIWRRAEQRILDKRAEYYEHLRDMKEER